LVTRVGALAGFTLVGALALTACSSGDNGTGTGTTPSASSSSSADCAAGSLSAQGSTFQANAELQWAKDYAASCSGATVAYEGTGSGAGKTAFGNGTADFGGTDSLLKPEEQAAADKRCGPGNKAIVTPIVAGAVVLTYNLDGVDKLTLDATTVAEMFSGTITSWDDPAIKALNPGTVLPSTKVVAVHRNDKSGSTKIFSGWLDGNDKADWTLGIDETLNWPSGQSAKGSDGVTGAVAGAKGGITYTELSFAKAQGLKVADIKNAAGTTVTPNAASVSAALQTATVGTDAGITVKPDYATKTADAYPLAAPSYVLTCDKGNKSVDLLKGYLTYALTGGTAALDGLGYAPLPDSIASQAKTQIDAFS
jgi:phosphate transport system substrate-binding protein